MKVKYSPVFINALKRVNVRIRKSLREKIGIFSKDPYSVQLNNHFLKREYQGCRSINITSDWRVVYRELREGKNTIAYFVTLGTHKQLYK